MERKRKFRVLNPRGITGPNGERVPLVGFGDKAWYEGDVIDPPPGFDADGRLEREGFLEVVRG